MNSISETQVSYLKSCKHAVGLQKFGLTVQDSISPRNSLLMVKIIEEKFDIKHVCFLYDRFNRKIQLKAMNPAIMDVLVTPSNRTFRELMEA